MSARPPALAEPPQAKAGAGPAPDVGPLVSVIMIFLDAERFIEEALKSVFAQTWPHWELLLVDDGSTDGSTAIARKLAARHPGRVRYLEHPGHINRGTGPSRNLGLRAARARYVSFLDSDDVWMPARLARHVDLLEGMPDVDMVQSRYLMWYSWDEEGERIDDDHLGPSFPIFDRPIAPPLCLRLLLAAPSYTPGLFNVTMRRQAAIDVGGFEDSFPGLFEDNVIFAKLYLEKTTYIIPDCLVRYRRHAWSYTRLAKNAGDLTAGLGCPAERAYLEWLHEYLRDRGVDDPSLREALRALMVGPPPSSFRTRLLGLRARALSALRAGLQALLPRPTYLSLVRRQRRRREQADHARLARLLGRSEA
jgi:glycosyltransferase involved in cell wall biosynthesis